MFDLTTVTPGNDAKGNTEYLNYLPDGDPAYYLGEITDYKWLDEKRIWIVDVEVKVSSNPTAPVGSVRTFTLQMGTEAWKIEAFKTGLLNVIYACMGFDPDNKQEVLKAPAVTAADTQAILGDDKPLVGSSLWIKVFRKKKKDGTWGDWSHYSFKPATFEGWTGMVQVSADHDDDIPF